MEENKTGTHWRTLMNTKYLNGDEIKDGIVTISDYKIEELYSQKSKEKEKHVTVTLAEYNKPMILTNRKAKQIAKALNTPYTENWVGKRITIFPIKEKHFGEWFEVINVKNAPEVKEFLDAKHGMWDKAKKSISENKTTIAILEKHYQLTVATKKELEKLVIK